MSAKFTLNDVRGCLGRRAVDTTRGSLCIALVHSSPRCSNDRRKGAKVYLDAGGRLQHFRSSCPSAVEWSRGTSTCPASVSTIAKRYVIALISDKCDFSMLSRRSRIKPGMVMVKERMPSNRTSQYIFRQLQQNFDSRSHQNVQNFEFSDFFETR